MLKGPLFGSKAAMMRMASALIQEKRAVQTFNNELVPRNGNLRERQNSGFDRRGGKSKFATQL